MLRGLPKQISKDFPDVKVSRRVLTEKGREIVYVNMRKRCSVSCDPATQKLVFPVNSPIDNIKKAIARLQEEQLTVNNEMETEINKEEESCNINYVKLLIERQKVINKDIKKFTDGLVKLYEQEVEKLVERSDAAGLLR